MKYLGRYWNDNEIEIYEIEGKKIALYGWNSEIYCDCFEVTDDLMQAKNDKVYQVRPIWKEIDEDEWDIIDYEII